MTKDELKKELDALGIDYAKDAKLADLEALYAPYAPGSTDDVTPEPDHVQEGADEGAASVPETAPGAKVGIPKTVACDRLNVRDAPNGEVLKVLQHGEEVSVLEDAEGWSSIVIEAWVKSEFLR